MKYRKINFCVYIRSICSVVNIFFIFIISTVIIMLWHQKLSIHLCYFLKFIHSCFVATAPGIILKYNIPELLNQHWSG